MICPNCKTEYRDGFYVCADCNINLVSDLPPPNMVDTPPATANFENIFETSDSYEFLEASKILKKAGIPFIGDELYTGEFRATRRAQAPYMWAILVPAEKTEEALQLLDKKVLGGPVMVAQVEEEPIKPAVAWLLLAAVAAIVIFIVAFIWKL